MLWGVSPFWTKISTSPLALWIIVSRTMIGRAFPCCPPHTATIEYRVSVGKFQVLDGAVCDLVETFDMYWIIRDREIPGAGGS